MNRKKFTICLPYEGEFETDRDYEMAKFEYMCNMYHLNDMLHVYGTVSLNEAIRCYPSARYKIFSYRWGWDFSKDNSIDVRLIKNPVNPRVWYLKFTAYDIVG